MTMELFVPIGKVKFIFFDENKEQFKKYNWRKKLQKIIVPPKYGLVLKDYLKLKA